MSNLHLCAHLINATSLERAEIVFDVACQNENGDWETTNGWIIYPLYATSLKHLYMQPGNPVVTYAEFSEGFKVTQEWLDHLQAEAVKYAARKPSPPRADLLSVLGLKPSTKSHPMISGKLTRRI